MCFSFKTNPLSNSANSLYENQVVLRFVYFYIKTIHYEVPSIPQYPINNGGSTVFATNL
jgi:hypothetical protein